MHGVLIFHEAKQKKIYNEYIRTDQFSKNLTLENSTPTKILQC